MRCFLKLLMILILASCSDQALSPEGSAVGIVRLNLSDPVRQNWEGTGERPLTTTIWYPATEGVEMTEIGIPLDRPVFIGGYAARGASLIDTQDTYPLIIMSHGTGGAAMQMMWLARSLAEKGYIVAAVDHHGNTAAENVFDPRGFRMPWERARDISAVLDQLLDHPDWGPRIDSSRIGAAGFSLGGYTVTALAGGKIDFDQFAAFCAGENRDATCDEQSEFPDAGKQFMAMLESDSALKARMTEHRDSFRDDRIRAVIALAPALGQAFTDDSLSEIDVSYLAIAGSDDDVAPPITNAQSLVAQIPGAQVRLVTGAGHYVFLNKCNRRGKRYVPVCKDPPDVDRTQVHDIASDAALEFFGTALKK